MSVEPSDHPILIRSASAATTQSILLLHPSAAASTYSVRTSRTTPESSIIPSRSGTPPAISFAPLPTVDPRKRRKSTSRPLGVAGRSEMIRRSHERQRDRYHDYDHDAQPRDAYEERRVHANTEEDDALIELGRLVKQAGKKIWEKMGNQKKSKPLEHGPLADVEAIRDSVDSEIKVPILLDDIQVAVMGGDTHADAISSDSSTDSTHTAEETFDPTKTIRGV